MAESLISLGANLGNRAHTLEEALTRLQSDPDVRLVQRSWPVRTESVGGPPGQAEFLNAAARLETTHDPQRLLDLLMRIESDLGRQRAERWDARTLDLDLLLYDVQCLRSQQLTVPHPRMTYRRFVLEPAAEIAPDMLHPLTGWTVRQLLDHLNQAPDYLAVVSAADYGQRAVVQAAAEATGAKAILAELPDTLPDLSRHGEEAVGDSTMRIALGRLEFRTLAEELESFSQRSSGHIVISDFWFGQFASDLAGEAGSSSPVGEELAEREAAQWRDLFERVPPPKLLVLIDPPVVEPRMAARAAALRERILGHYRRPVLHLETADPALILSELVAALKTFRRLPV